MIALLWLLACGGGATELTPENLAAIAEEIEAEPARAEEILTEHGTDRAGFEAALYDVAADPAKTDTYLAARH